MKHNGNNFSAGDWYLGLDVGTESAGWAATDPTYHLLKYHGKEMWGARLFAEAEDASGRRTARTNRRRLARRKWRLQLLEELFAPEILKIDPGFFIRLHDSNLYPEDKHDKACKYSLFCDKDYTDKDYLREYPNIYCLRSELIHSSEPHDARLVFLALHHIMKSRGHFLYEFSDSDTGVSLSDALQQFKNTLADFGVSFSAADQQSFLNALQEKTGISQKAKNLQKAYGKIESSEEPSGVSVAVLLELLAGKKVNLCKLFNDEKLKEAELASVSLSDNLEDEEIGGKLSDELGDRMDVILHASEVFNTARLDEILAGYQYFSDAKIAEYDQNKKDLRILKGWIKKNCPDKYRDVFRVKQGVKNFAAYTRYKTDEKCTQEEMCKFLDKICAGMKNDSNPDVAAVYAKISSKSFFPRLKGSENGLVPYQLQKKELMKILDNAQEYLPFLNEEDANGITVRQKIESIFTFKIPYYVGPLSTKSPRNNIVRKSNEKIYPWNFEDVIDLQETQERFIADRIGRCYYSGDPVLPKDSLLNNEYCVRNEINKLKVNGEPVSPAALSDIYQDLFVDSSKKVTAKRLKDCLLKHGYIEKSDQLSGFDTQTGIKSNLRSYHDFSQILSRENSIPGVTNMVEDIIERIVVCGDDKKLLRKWLVSNYGKVLTDKDIKHILKLNYKDWGRMSKKILTGISSCDENGEQVCIMDLLRSTNKNFMEIYHDERYGFDKKAQQYKQEKYGAPDSLQDVLDTMYISPRVKRGIHQTMKVIDELIDIRKCAPKKIFIEMARDQDAKNEKKRTDTRQERLIALYRSCRKQIVDLLGGDEAEYKRLYSGLQSLDNDSLRRDKLYLYYTQLGRCMYSGERIDLASCLANNERYDIDHIFPRSRVKDDSISNRVLVKTELNRDKEASYPIDESIRKRMSPFWTMLNEKELISDKKFDRLTRNYPLTADELSSFVARQLVETRQSTKALADILHSFCPNSKIVYSKAQNVTDFRHEFKIPKFRDINDQHHAKDAYLNIVVGNVYDTKFTEQFFRNIQNEKYTLKTEEIFKWSVPGAWNGKDNSSLKLVKHYCAKNNPIVTFACFPAKGIISDLKLRPHGNGSLFPVKQGMDPQKYGGYKNLSVTYYCVVEYQKKTKRIRSIEPVYLYDHEKYENNPELYFSERGYKDPRIICKRILVNVILEINGVRFSVTGKTNNRYVARHMYQFALSDDNSKYLKNAKKYIERDEQESEDSLARYELSKEKNIELFDLFVSKMQTTIYSKVGAIKSLGERVGMEKKPFSNLSLKNQCIVLLQILKVFKCNRELSDLSLIGLSKNSGVITINNTLDKVMSAFLIYQSPTGLTEKKVNLLK